MRRDDDRDDPFDDLFSEIERMMNEMMGGNTEFHFEQGAGARSNEGRDVHMDVHESEEEVRLVADIPGVDKEAIDLQCDGTTLDLRASGNGRDYREHVPLPAPVDEHSASATYNNGVLEVVFDRADDATSIDI
jgi:HSP20 family protein